MMSITRFRRRHVASIVIRVLCVAQLVAAIFLSCALVERSESRSLLLRDISIGVEGGRPLRLQRMTNSENLSENPIQPKRRRGRPRLFDGKPTRNEQNLFYAQVAQRILIDERFKWIHQGKTLLAELGRINDPATMIKIADAITSERRTCPNRKPWPTTQMLRRIVRQWRRGQNAIGSNEELIKESEALIQDYRERHPKLKKSQVTKALSFVLFVCKGTPWANNRPDRIVRRHGFFQIDSSWPSDRDCDKEINRRRLAKEIIERKHRFRSEI
jgi:hypothetical protein